jgi:hypothetical protein
MKIGKTSFVLAAALAALPAAAAAQACNGFPTAPGQYSVAGVVNFPSGYNEFGVEASYHFAGPGAVNGGILHDSGDGDSLDHLRIGGSWDLAPVNVGMSHPISVCPTAMVDYASKGGVSQTTVPLGVGFGLTLPMGADPRSQIMPYVVPAAVIDHIGGDLGSDTRTNFGLRGGALVTFGSFYVGGEVSKVFGDLAPDALFGVKVGFRAR